jgi:hypothetical protein
VQIVGGGFVDLRTVAGRAWKSCVACRCHSSMVSR